MRRITPQEAVASLNGTPLVVMLDIDGTLCDISEHPGGASIPEGGIASLRALNAVNDGTVQVAFVTGRSVADAQRMLGVRGALIYGNHGMERLSRAGSLRVPDGWESQ
ncbi:MAG TPA: trehalose-phosphatase, partial [Gemmatimonadaceae bacterium]